MCLSEDRPGACGYPTAARKETHSEVRAGATVAKRVKPPLGQHGCDPLEARDVSSPLGDRVIPVETDRFLDCAPKGLHVRGAENLLRPTGVRRGDYRPADQSLAHRSDRLGGQLLRSRPPHSASVEAGHQLGLGLARDLDERGLLGDKAVHHGNVPPR